MSSLLVGLVPLLLGAFLFSLFLRWQRAGRRARATRLSGPLLREARDLSARLFVENSVVGGPQASGLNRSRADLVLRDDLLVLATHQGRVLQIDAAHPGTASCTGPMRLVIEGQHPSGITRVRVELVVEDAEGWARAISGIKGA